MSFGQWLGANLTSSFLGGSLGRIDVGGAVGNVIKGAIVGGTSSAVGGGKFANGAVSAAAGAAVDEAAVVTSAFISDKLVAKARRDGEAQQRRIANMAEKQVNRYFDDNPDQLPPNLKGQRLNVKYMHVNEPGMGAAQKGPRIERLVKRRILGIFPVYHPLPRTLATNGEIEMYMGSAATLENAVKTILHEYAHHLQAVIDQGVKDGNYNSNRAEYKADEWAVQQYTRMQSH
jgi:hypothetical protein